MRTTRLLGLSSTLVGIALLLFTFATGFLVFLSYWSATASNDLSTSMGMLLLAAMQALFLGIMGWVGSILVLRGIDFIKVDKGVGVVTFKVDKGVGIVTQQDNSADMDSEDKPAS